MNNCWLLAGTAAMALVSSGANAFAYSEAIDGDILESAPPTFLLDAGINTVSGRQDVLWTAAGVISVDRDNFSFVVPTGTTLAGVSISWSNYLPFGGIDDRDGHGNGFVSCALQGAAGNPIASVGSNSELCIRLTDATSGTRELFSDALPLDAGTYRWFNTRSVDRFLTFVDSGWSLDYTLTLTVHRVPEPSALALLGLGLAGAGFAVARRRRAN